MTRILAVTFATPPSLALLTGRDISNLASSPRMEAKK